MVIVRAAVVGFMTVVFVEFGLCFALLVLAHSAGWRDLHLVMGSLEFFSIRTAAKDMSLSTGNGLFVVAILAGALNAAGAYWLRRAEN